VRRRGDRSVRPLRPQQHRARQRDAGLIRIDEETGLGVALATDCNSRFSFLNPYGGAQLSLLEAYRNVVVAGAEPVAVTDCLNFGSPEDPTVMWQFREAVLGLVDGCRALGIPVTGGNVSFYNQTGDVAILPTPTVGVMGVIDDVSRRVRSSFAHEGDAVVLLGTTDDDPSGSAWADVIHDHHLGGRPPRVAPTIVRLCSLFQVHENCSRAPTSRRRTGDGLVEAACDATSAWRSRCLTVTRPFSCSPDGRAGAGVAGGARCAGSSSCATSPASR
jgi:phosphoribosylformylglycinamidine (FGAM) synthase-like enzyme